MDVEATDLSPHYDRMTVVGIYDCKRAKAFVRGIDLDGIVDEFAKYDFLITYNGARFRPAVHKTRVSGDRIHPDAHGSDVSAAACRLHGRSHAIEQVLGVTRSEDTTEITGFDAVRLWHECERGSLDSYPISFSFCMGPYKVFSCF